MKKVLIFLLFLGLVGTSLSLVLPFKARAGVSSAQCVPSVSEAVVGQEITFSAQIEGTYSSLRWYDITNSIKSGSPPSDAVLVGSGSSLKLKFDSSGIKKIMLCPVWQQFNCYPAATCQVVIKPQGTQGAVKCGDNNSRCVFVTSNTYYPDFGGPEGGDKICNDLAKAAGLPGSYKAWLSGTDFQNRKAINVADRLEHAAVPFKLVDGTVVANNWSDLTTKPLLHAINLDEKGQAVAPRWVWTGSMPNGQRTPATIGVIEPDCGNWSMRYSCCASGGWNSSTNNDPRGFDPVTRENINPPSWGGEMYARLGCNQAYHLYCFQQGGQTQQSSQSGVELPPSPPGEEGSPPVVALTGNCSCSVQGAKLRLNNYYALPNQEVTVTASCTGFTKTPNYTWYIPYYSNLTGPTVKIKYSNEGTYLLKFNAVSSDYKEANTSSCTLVIKSTHKECQNQKCVSVSGADIDLCSKDSDCQTTKPTPTSTPSQSPLSITVTNPQPNENITIGSTYTVRWTVQGDTSKIRNFAMILYSTLRKRAEGMPYGWNDGPNIRSFQWHLSSDELPGDSWLIIQAYVMKNNDPRDVDLVESPRVPIKFVSASSGSPFSSTSSGSSVSGSPSGGIDGGTTGGTSGGGATASNVGVSLKATPLTSLSKTVYTNQYATFKVQVTNTSSQTVNYRLRASATVGLDKLIITPQTLTLKPNTSRTVWVFAKDKNPGNYQISVEAANSSQGQLFTLLGIDLWVNSRASKTPSVAPISPPQNEIPSPSAPVTSGGSTGGSGLNVGGAPVTEKTAGVPGLTQAEREAAARPQIIYNPYAQVFQDQYKGYYPGSIASQYQSGIYQGNTIQYEGKTLVAVKRCHYHHTLSDPGFAFGAYGGPEAFVQYSTCWNTWVEKGSGNDYNECTSDAQCVQKALSLINQKKQELSQTTTPEQNKAQCYSGETHCIGKEIWTCVNGKWQITPCPTYCTSQDRCKGVNDIAPTGSTVTSTSSNGTSSGGGGGHMFYYNYLPPAYFNLPFAFMPIEFLMASFGQIFSR